MNPATTLRLIKLLRIVVWLIFALCIMMIPVLGYLNQFLAAAWMVGFVPVEFPRLVCNGRRSPLTDLAARYTRDREANFDLYLPRWLTHHN